MLYDPKWEIEVKADPYSLESLIAWLEKQPAGKTYCYERAGHCLIAQYLTAMGFTGVSISPYTYRHDPDRENRKELPEGWAGIARPWGGLPTFGKALERARRFAAK